MAKQIKDRKIYSISGFRGLDKENKAVKVEPQRASDGYNFILDSDTIKTRPALKLKSKLPFDLETNDYLIDFYQYGDIWIYVTRYHFYFKDGDSIFDESSLSYNIIKSSDLINIDFLNRKPFFKEEKDALFIYCLTHIYVFSSMYDEENDIKYYVIYNISDKPAVSDYFDATSYFYEIYNNMPVPYEPTIFIGENSYDDINLLSPVTKYDLFSPVDTDNLNEEKNNFKLYTNYDKDKNGDYSVDINFFKNKFDNLEVFPFYLGIEGDDFDNGRISSDFYGTLITDEINVDGIFNSQKVFKFYGTSSSIESTISKTPSLKKTDFYAMTTNNQNIFEFILNYIKINQDSYSENKVLKFNLDIKYQAEFYDSTTNYLVEITTITETYSVYVQLIKYDSNVNFESQEYVGSEISYSYQPSYPVFYDDYVEYSPDFILDISSSPIQKTGYNLEYFYSLAKTFLESNIDTTFDDTADPSVNRVFVNGDKILLHGQFYDTVTINVPSFSSYLVSYLSWNYSSSAAESSMSTYPDLSTFVFNSYPNFSNPNGYDVLETTNIYNVNATYFNYNDSTLTNWIRNEINTLKSTLSYDSGSAFIKFHYSIYYRVSSGGSTIYYREGKSVVVPFTFSKYVESTANVYQSFSMRCTVAKTSSPVTNSLYDFTFDENFNRFELNIRDFFYDFDTEPSINVKVTFQYNPDIKLIENSTFGTIFGSEDRIFLTGNEDYKNIDRYNISNNLLGDNVKNQSYESSYFPSKNFRVIGGKGAINGYAIATDSNLYVSKEDYPNDGKIFVRKRSLDDNGLVVYNEYRTSINLSPINENCFVRFNNDIVMLTKKGLYAIELSSNILADERLLKMRSGFLNKEIIEAISTCDSHIFILEDNDLMYMFIGKNIYVADSRYMGINANSAYGNTNYEIVKWIMPTTYASGRFIQEEDKFLIIDGKGTMIYSFEEGAFDDNITKYKDTISTYTDDKFSNGDNIFIMPISMDGFLDDAEDRLFMLSMAFRRMASLSKSDYHIEGDRIYIDNIDAFRSLKDGDTIYFKDISNEFHSIIISGLEDNEMESFTLPEGYEGNPNDIYINCSNIPLYVSLVANYPEVGYVFRLSQYKPDKIVYITEEDTEGMTDDEIKEYITESFTGNNDYYIGDIATTVYINETNPIKLRWISSMLDFGNNFMEKTMFSTNIYASKGDFDGQFSFGYKTMRKTEYNSRFNVFSVENSGVMDLDSLAFNFFSISSFSEIGTSIKTKENNFLYIQLVIDGYGYIALNSIEILYKLNRLLKTIA